LFSRRGRGAGGGCGGRREISLTSGEISVVGASAERSDSRGAGGRVVGKGGRRSVAASAGLPRRPPVFIPRRRRPPPAVAWPWLRLPFYLPATHLPFPTAHLRCARPRAGVPCATNPPLPPKPGDLARKLVTVEGVNGGGEITCCPLSIAGFRLRLRRPMGDQIIAATIACGLLSGSVGACRRR